jgi:hypothetical protein
MTQSEFRDGDSELKQELRMISLDDLSIFAIEDIAYVKPMDVAGETLFAIHAADGTQLGVAYDRDIAFVAVRQHDLEPVSVH